MRTLFKLLSFLSLMRAIRKGPRGLATRQVRKLGHRNVRRIR